MKNILFFPLIFIYNLNFAQIKDANELRVPKFSFIVSPTVYNADDTYNVEIIKLLQAYHADFYNKENFTKNWAIDTTQQLKVPDVLLRSALMVHKQDSFIANLIFIEKCMVFYKAKIAYSVVKNDSLKGVICIYNHFIKKDADGKLLFFQASSNFSFLKMKQDGCVFYRDSESANDTLGINKMINFNNRLSKIFGEKLPFTYYSIKNEEKFYKIFGFDFEQYMFMHGEASGITDIYNNIIYSHNNSFYYPHELVHVYVNNYYASTCHDWFNEGLATYWGGARGLTLEQHLSKMNSYLKAHPEIDLNRVLELLRIDDITNYENIIGGLICKLMYEKEKYNGIFRLLNSGTTDEDFYKTIEKYLHVKKQDLNAFLRKEIGNTNSHS